MKTLNTTTKTVVIKGLLKHSDFNAKALSLIDELKRSIFMQEINAFDNGDFVNPTKIDYKTRFDNFDNCEKESELWHFGSREVVLFDEPSYSIYYKNENTHIILQLNYYTHD